MVSQKEENILSNQWANLALRNRTIQVYPKDLRALPVHPEPAVSWHSGFRGGAHARHKTTPVLHAAQRRSSRVAAAGAAFLRLLIHAGPSPCGARQLPP